MRAHRPTRRLGLMALAASTLVLLFGALSVHQARQGDGGPRPTQGEVQQVASSTPSSASDGHPQRRGEWNR